MEKWNGRTGVEASIRGYTGGWPQAGESAIEGASLPLVGFFGGFRLLQPPVAGGPGPEVGLAEDSYIQ